MADNLYELRRNWGEAYEIETDSHGMPRARRRDKTCAWITAGTIEELHTRIVDDYTTNPVRETKSRQDAATGV